MRFIANGPWIPDALLTARDAGEVLFFCGAGVSRHKANLPDFSKLAWDVADQLGSTQNGPARRLLSTANPGTEGGPPPIPVAVDRVFSLLQQEFEIADVQKAVAQALRADDDCDLSPHRHLLDLSRTRSGPPRLVTTNFDLLFERAKPGIRSHAPPRLPDPRRPVDFHGIVHLHGAVNSDHDGAQNDEFVLSSAEFGHAYLSDGWATRYIQTLLKRFQIVFVGYSADDPPVQYLLEAMNRPASATSRMYAFHKGTAQEAEAQWSHRGVTPIPFDDYDALWNTVALWAQRARDIDAWYYGVIERAQAGPAVLSPQERGMVAHLAHSTESARYLLMAKHPLPAEWLFVFDRAIRYSRARLFTADTSPDPFDVLGLDSDPTPAAVDPKDRTAPRPIPEGTWDAFDIASEDQRATSREQCTRLIGRAALLPGKLPARLAHLSQWIVKVAHEPATVWWAAGLSGMSPELRQHIERELVFRDQRFPGHIRQAWRLVFNGTTIDANNLRYAIAREVETEGWSPARVKAAIGLYRPHIAIRRPNEEPWVTPPVDVALGSLVRAEVEYPRPHLAFTFPDDHRALAARLFRRQLEDAIQLEGELHTRPYFLLDRIRPDDGEGFDETGYKMSGHVATLAKMVLEAAAVDADAARTEVCAWARCDDEVFKQLRIWAAGRAELTSPAEAEATFRSLNTESCWLWSFVPGQLFARSDRWRGLSEPATKELERRLLHEDLPWFHERSDRQELIAHYRLNRLAWLKSHGVVFSFDYDEVMAELKIASPRWNVGAAEETATRSRVRVRSVEADDDDAVLETVALDEVIAKAAEIEQSNQDRGKQRDPFAGLAKRRPVHALRALSAAAKRGRLSGEAWTTLLNAQIKDKPATRLMVQTARRLCTVPADILEAVRHAVADWLTAYAAELMTKDAETFDRLWEALVVAASTADREADSSSHTRDWIGEAINRPIGKMAELLFKDERLQQSERNAGLPTDWTQRMEQLIAQPVPHGMYALTIAAHQLCYLYYRDEQWVEQHLLSRSVDGGPASQAFWAGFLSAAVTPQPPLYALMKASLLARATDVTLRRSYRKIVAGMLLLGWRGNETCEEPRYPISDAELREVLVGGGDELRSHTLWQLGRWAADEAEEWSERVVLFLRNVWPLQRAVRTPASSSALVALAFEVPEALFEEVVEAILPRVVTVSPSASLGAVDNQSQDTFVSNHAKSLLRLLWATLSDDAQNWPYGAIPMVEALRSQEQLRADPQLDELLRRRHQAGFN